MSEKTVMVTKQAEVLTVTLHRPEALNALNDEMTEELRQVLEAAAADASVRVVVLTGSGRAFCAGGDLNYLESIAGTAEAKAFIEEVGNLVKIIREMPKPVLAKVHGVAAGAGFNLALACDLVIASRSAKFAQSFAKVGLVPDCGGLYLLPRLLGMHRAKELMFIGDAVTAETLYEWGLLNHLAEADELDEEAGFWAARLAIAPPLALEKTKAALHASQEANFEQMAQMEAQLQALCLETEDHQEGVAAFREKRKPAFSGR